MAAPVSKFESAIQALIEVLQGISTAAGYQTDVKSVRRVYEVPHEIPDDEMPFLGIAGTTRTPAAEQVVNAAMWDLLVHVRTFVPDGDDAGAVLSALEADIEKALEADRQLGGMAGWAEILKVRQATQIEAVNFAMGLLDIRIDVEHLLGDATQ